MEHLSREDLESRARDILNNSQVLTRDAKIGLHPIKEGGEYWITLFTHVLEEFAIRFGPYPSGFDSGFLHAGDTPAVIHQKSPKAKLAAEAINKTGFIAGSFLAKYGKLKHLSPAIKMGIFLVSPASIYNDPSLNHAQKDDELSLSIQPYTSEIKFLSREDTVGNSGDKRESQENSITIISDTNYYVFCLSSILEPRLFLDFNDADACLVIKKPGQFIARFHSAVESQLGGWNKGEGFVRYIDPLNSTADDVQIISCKNFRYAYQKEFRLVWLPPQPRQELDPFKIEIGSLEEICELIVL
jgi:hypothetical protein